jgi:hypothetical protein
MEVQITVFVYLKYQAENTFYRDTFFQLQAG